jgi:hypothetical protein
MLHYERQSRCVEHLFMMTPHQGLLLLCLTRMWCTPEWCSYLHDLVAGLLETLRRNNEVLERVGKNLEDYLETKRMAFPRFYFLSNDELLDILAQAKAPQVYICLGSILGMFISDCHGSHKSHNSRHAAIGTLSLVNALYLSRLCLHATTPQITLPQL